MDRNGISLLFLFFLVFSSLKRKDQRLNFTASILKSVFFITLFFKKIFLLFFLLRTYLSSCIFEREK
jgi:hypothetical protein